METLWEVQIPWNLAADRRTGGVGGRERMVLGQLCVEAEAVEVILEAAGLGRRLRPRRLRSPRT